MSWHRKDTVLRADKVCVTYDKPILRDIELSVQDIVRPDVTQGQVASIIGRSGIGKSQLLRCLAGLQKPTSGRVLIGSDQHVVRPGEVGVVPQNYILWRHRTVQGNLWTAAQRNSEIASIDDEIEKMATEFNLLDHLKKYPHELSGGQRQRVSILQQLLAGNRTILFDEPFSGLDATMIEKLLSVMQRVVLQHEMNTLVIVSHDIESALAISDIAFVLGLDDQPGATIKHTVDLAERGLAFQPEIRDLPAFRETVREVKSYL